VKVQKRSKLQIYFDILLSLHRELGPGQKVTPTRLAHQANVPYDRFQYYLHHLIELGLVAHEEETFAVTRKGLEYIEEFAKTTELLKRMGLLL
jgi:predicted transcriptional regulator